MATTTIDKISPFDLGEDKFDLELNSSSQTLAGLPVWIDIGYTQVPQSGLVFPLELIVQPAFGDGGVEGGYIREKYTRTAPSSYMFIPPSAGRYLIVLKELFHNRWQGRLVVTVSGDEFSRVDTLART